MEGLRERSYRRSGALARAAFTVLLVACSGLLAQESEPGNAGDVIKRMRETGKVNQGASTSLVGEARKHRTLGELFEAELKLQQALNLWPSNEPAQQLLDEVRMLRGDRRGEVPVVAKDIREQLMVQRQMLRYEIERQLNRAMQFAENSEYDKAIDSYNRAIDGINHAPFDLGIDAYLVRAKQGLARSESEKKRKDFEDQQTLLRMIQQSKREQEAESLDFIENHIRALRRRATAARENHNYDKAGELYEKILSLNPHDEDAQNQNRLSREHHHIQQLDMLLRANIDNYRKAVLGVLESSVIYQDIFRYPDKDEWIRLSPKVVTIEEQIAKFESPLEKEIRRKLAQSITYGLEEPVPLREALSDLQGLTGVNFFIQSTDIGDTEVQLETLNNLPLSNVLAFLLKNAGDGVGYVIREGAVVIAEDEEQLQEPKYLRFYEISDLVDKRPDFPADDLALEEMAGQSDVDAAADIAFGDDEEESVGDVYEKDELLSLIARELNAGGDAEGEEEVEGIRIHPGGKLMALTTLQNHIKLAKILERFRKATGMMVTVESRFLDIQDNFLESIGINIGNAQANFLPNTIPDIDGNGTALNPGYEFTDAGGEMNLRVASIGALSNPLGSQVNPFNLSGTGGGTYQVNAINPDRFVLEALLTGVAKDQEIRRLNSPRVTAFNTQTAHTLVVNQAAYIQDLEVNQTGVIPVINPVIGVLNTGSILEVRPTISFDRKYVVLEIQPTLAEQIGESQALLNLSGGFTTVPVQLPIVSVTKIKTTVNVPDGGTVLLGGLKREVKQEASIGLPALRRLPLANLFFGRNADAALRSNLFVLINTHITVVHEEEARLFGTGI
ncbi:MAG: type II and III secretion system protein [Planctomycetes bacterium]|nr:type II and III secretion system protein [Planctomycetota bacterium]